MASTRLYWELISPWTNRSRLERFVRDSLKAKVVDGTNKTHPYVEIIGEDGIKKEDPQLRRIMKDLSGPSGAIFVPEGCLSVCSDSTVEYTLVTTGKTDSELENLREFRIVLKKNGISLGAVCWASPLYNYALSPKYDKNRVLKLNVRAVERELGQIDEPMIYSLLYNVAKSTGLVFNILRGRKFLARKEPEPSDWHFMGQDQRDDFFDEDDSKANYSGGVRGYDELAHTLAFEETEDDNDEDNESINVDRVEEINVTMSSADKILVLYYLQAVGTDSPRVQFLHFYNCLEYFVDKEKRTIVKIRWDALFKQNKRDPWQRDFDDYFGALDQFGGEERSLANQLGQVIPDLEFRLRAFLGRDSGQSFIQDPAQPLKALGVSKLDPGDSDLLNLAIRRIYRVRNGIVHAKNGIDKLVPFETDDIVAGEIPLVRFLTECLMDL